MSTPDPTASPGPVRDSRQRALREELTSLADVVGPAQLVDLLVERAFEMNATDVHLDPNDQGLRVRLRVDGLLHDVLQLPEAVRSNVVSRIKLLAGMDITERRHSRDGHIAGTSLSGGRDIRVGSSPTIYGERLVLRLMPEATSFSSIEDLGLADDQLQLLRKQLSTAYGMVVVAGPVGSGKSTTLYSCLEGLNNPNRSLATIEDPVERRINGVNQIQIEPKQGFGFAEALKGVLRQDPNVLMVGEIRDADTAQIACRAGMTGILVLSTIHAHDAAAVIDVLRDYGIPPMFIADSIRCIVSQRLIRKVCEDSRERYTPDEATAHALDLSAEEAARVELVRGVPAESNFHTGYRGRTGVFEILPMTREIRRAILRNASQGEIADLARNQGVRSLSSAARDKVLNGTTTVEEMHRVLLAP